VGFISDEDRNHLFRTAVCAVFPSLYEPFGIVALEAMALLCPIVVSDVGGFSEMVRHMDTGITVYPDDAASIAWGILHTLDNPDAARNHALKARQSVKMLFNWPRIAGLTIEVYQRVLSTQAGEKVSL
jgi:glycosyltransferase involved in cell wall biosynthesis